MDLPPFPERLIPGFHVRILRDAAGVAVECSGMLEAEDAAERLDPEFLKLHQALVDSGVKAVRLNLRPLTYMNSGSIKAFASWFTRIENGGKPVYTLEAHHDPASTWQGWTLGVLQRLAPNAVRLVPPRRR